MSAPRSRKPGSSHSAPRQSCVEQPQSGPALDPVVEQPQSEPAPGSAVEQPQSGPALDPVVEQQIEEMVNRVHETRAQLDRWLASDPEGRPTDIALKEQKVGYLTEVLEQQEEELRVARGDYNVAPATPQPTGTGRIHRTDGGPSRRDTLTPVIEQAQQTCRDPHDVAEVWNVLTKLAEQETTPLLAATSDGIKYSVDAETRYLTRMALRERLRRQKTQCR